MTDTVAQHTAGPWEPQQAHPGKVKGRVWTSDPSGPCIAEVRSSFADAQLIAAAPTMYEALKEIEKASRTPGTASGHIGFLARRVLAEVEPKAESVR